MLIHLIAHHITNAPMEFNSQINIVPMDFYSIQKFLFVTGLIMSTVEVTAAMAVMAVMVVIMETTMVVVTMVLIMEMMKNAKMVSTLLKENVMDFTNVPMVSDSKTNTVLKDYY